MPGAGCCAVVVQPGVEFGDHGVQAYDRARAAGLCAAARALPGLVLEGHSTDYQSPAALRALVEDGVAILKVGPALTFAMREALFALEHVERELGRRPSLPAWGRSWSGPCWPTLPTGAATTGGRRSELRLARRFSLLDRCRYYWTAPPVQRAVERLLANLRGQALPWTAAQPVPAAAGRPVLEGRLPVGRAAAAGARRRARGAARLRRRRAARPA